MTALWEKHLLHLHFVALQEPLRGLSETLLLAPWMTTGMLQAAVEMQTVACIGTLGLRPISNSGYNPLSYKTRYSSAPPSRTVSVQPQI